MTTEIVQTNEYGEVEKTISVDTPPMTEPMLIQSSSATENAEETWTTFQVKAKAFFADATQTVQTFFRENQQILSILGWVLLALLGIRVVFAALDAIDDIPLVTPALKLIGLTTVAWFIWRYLIRANNRQELAQMFDRTKSELFGNQD